MPFRGNFGRPPVLPGAAVARVAALPVVALLCWATGCSPSSTKAEKHGQGGTALSKKVEFVVFTARWCDVCREVPAVLSRLRKEFPAVSFRDLDVDEEDNFKLYVKYKADGADGLPYMFVLADDIVIAQLRGLLPYEKIASFLRDALPQ